MTDGSDVYHPILGDLRSRSRYYNLDLEIAFQDENSYGPGAAITAWEGLIDEDFTVLFGDNLYEGTLPWLDPGATHFSYRTLGSNPRNLQLAAVIDNYIVEKPHAFLEGRFFCGFAHFPRNFWATLPQLQRSGRGEYEITDMINLAEKTISWDIDDIGLTWGDITYKRDIEKIEALVQ
jgi:dTDP-glucose pyrophosphorylase